MFPFPTFCPGVVNPLPNRSLDFERGSSQFLSMSDANWGAFDRALFSFSDWINLESISGTNDGEIITQGSGSNCGFFIGVHNTGGLCFNVYTDGTNNDGILVSNATITPGTWYHVQWIWDGMNATANNRMRMKLNGTELTSFASRMNPPQTSIFNSTAAIQLGKESNNNVYYDGLMFQPAFFSGVIPNSSDLIAGGHPKDVRGLSGLWSLLHTTDSSTLEDDYVKGTNWTNNGGVVKSLLIPS